jgi:hypothetical protein
MKSLLQSHYGTTVPFEGDAMVYFQKVQVAFTDSIMVCRN